MGNMKNFYILVLYSKGSRSFRYRGMGGRIMMGCFIKKEGGVD